MLFEDARATMDEIQMDPPLTITPQTTIYETLQLMNEYNKQSYGVVNEKGQLMGMVTRSDISNIGLGDTAVGIQLLKETKMEDIAKTLKGRVIYDAQTPHFSGKLSIIALTESGLSNYDIKDRMVLLGNDVEAQKTAIKMGAGVLVIVWTEYVPEDVVELAKEYFTTIGLEIYPLNSDEYAFLHEKGADFVSVYQETYDPIFYKEVHLKGPKRDFSYRFNAQERALMGGMRGVGIGALLGLHNFRNDALATGLHAKFLQQKYPHAEISFSVPRLRPYINNSENNPNDVHETQLLQIMLAYRILLPFAGINISTRERAGFRDNVVGLCATKISAGVKTSVGGHQLEEKGDAQFEISDPRSVDEIRKMLKKRGLQEVFTDYIRL